jgi:hypothetical protein
LTHPRGRGRQQPYPFSDLMGAERGMQANSETK